MRHPLRILVLLTALLGAALARADWIEQSNRYALEVLNARSELQPEYASNFGLDQFDADVSELGPDISQRWIALNEKLVEGLLGNLATEKDPRVRQDLQIMIDALRADIASEQIESRHFLPYYNLHELMFRSFRSLLDPRNDRERYPAALQRLSKYAGRAASHPPITQQAVARTTERLGEEALLGPYRGELETDLDNAARYVEGIAGLFEQAGLQGWQEDLALLQEQLEEYRSWLQETLLPRARTDPRLPAEVYANNLKEYGVTLSPAELIEQGQYSYQLLRSEMKSLALRIADQCGWEKNDLLPVMQALKREQVPADELLPLYQSRPHEPRRSGAIPGGAAGPVPRHGQLRGGPLCLPHAGAGYRLLRRLHQPDAPAHRGRTRTGRGLRPARLPRLHPGAGTAATADAARGGVGALRALIITPPPSNPLNDEFWCSNDLYCPLQIM